MVHWEKIPLYDELVYEDGTTDRVNLLQRQVKKMVGEDKDVQLRIVRTKHKDGSESLSMEKLVRD